MFILHQTPPHTLDRSLVL